MNCSTCKNKGIPKGCKGNGSCLNNGCNQRSVYNWLSDFDTLQPAQQNVVELSFKNGRKDFGLNSNKLPLQVGDLVLISTSHGKDMGTVSLTGELVQFQIRRKKAEKIFNRFPEIIRKADKEDIMGWKKIREKEDDYMLKARIIASDLGLIMKISDAEIQADGKKIIPKQIRPDRSIVIYPNERVLIATGIIMDIPVRHSVRLHARSGNAFKKGLTLANSEGIIDNDYVEEIKIIMMNLRMNKRIIFWVPLT